MANHHHQQHEKKKMVHFSHKHPLTLVDIEEDEKEQSKSDEYSKNRYFLRCYGCTEKIGCGVPYYRCKEHCPSFCLHHACAHLPTTIRRSHICGRDLQLMKRPNKDRTSFCTVCWKDWYRFTYVCSVCGFGIEVSCAMKGPNEAKHSFHQHPVEPFLISQRKVDDDDSQQLVCSVCSLIITPFRGDRYLYYRCNYCNFIVHPQCTNVPDEFQSPSHHPGHQFYLDFNYPGSKICKICQEEIDRNTQWAYYCSDCDREEVEYYIHAGYEGCLTSTIREGGGVTIDASDVVNLPLDGEPILKDILTDGKIIKHHRHPMILFADQFKSNIVAIKASFTNLIRGSSKWPTFRVDGKDYSGITFSFYNSRLTMQVTGVELPRYIKHEDHPHVLGSTFLNSSTWCHACEQSFFGRGFKCITCAFTIDTYCALLPRIIKHRYDKHGFFSLTYSAIEGVEEYVCEICEEDVIPRYFYHCAACDQSIHSRCIWNAYVQFDPYYKFDIDRGSVILVPPSEELPKCIICKQKETYGHGFAFKDADDGEYMVHLTCISEDDVKT